MIRSLLALALIAGAPAGVAVASQGDEAGMARKDLRAGNVRPLREIEQRVLPMMAGAQYLGPEYDPAAYTYRLKFIRNGRVMFVDVDARSGEVLRQSR
ncbi:MAG: PepSY domain-containing protein [Novosphingobium sp.]